MSTNPVSPSSSITVIPPALPVATFDLHVKTFYDVRTAGDRDKSLLPPQDAFTTHRLSRSGGNAANVWLKGSDHLPTYGHEVIRVHSKRGGPYGARLSFAVLAEPGGPSDGDSFEPIGVCFQRVDLTEPMAVPVDAPGVSPFGRLQITGSTLEFEVVPLSKDDLGAQAAPNQQFMTYKFYIYIRRVRDNALGVIDPYTENEIPY